MIYHVHNKMRQGLVLIQSLLFLKYIYFIVHVLTENFILKSAKIREKEGKYPDPDGGKSRGR